MSHSPLNQKWTERCLEIHTPKVVEHEVPLQDYQRKPSKILRNIARCYPPWVIFFVFFTLLCCYVMNWNINCCWNRLTNALQQNWSKSTVECWTSEQNPLHYICIKNEFNSFVHTPHNNKKSYNNFPCSFNIGAKLLDSQTIKIVTDSYMCNLGSLSLETFHTAYGLTPKVKEFCVRHYNYSTNKVLTAAFMQ